MKLYLLNVLQSNEVADLMNEEMVAVFNKHKAMVYQSSPEEAMKYLTQLMFETEEDREALADEIPQIAFEYGEIDYPDELYQKAKNGEVEVDLSEKPKKYKETELELKIDAWLERNDFEFHKHYYEGVNYAILLPNNKKAVIMLGSKDKSIVGGVERGQMIVCKERKYIRLALNQIFKEIEEASVSEVVS